MATDHTRNGGGARRHPTTQPNLFHDNPSPPSSPVTDNTHSDRGKGGGVSLRVVVEAATEHTKRPWRACPTPPAHRSLSGFAPPSSGHTQNTTGLTRGRARRRVCAGGRHGEGPPTFPTPHPPTAAQLNADTGNRTNVSTETRHKKDEKIQQTGKREVNGTGEDKLGASRGGDVGGKEGVTTDGGGGGR